MKRFTIESQNDRVSRLLRFEAGGGKLVVLGVGNTLPDAIVRAFSSHQDVYYATPTSPTPQELSEEVRIHIPESLLQTPSGKLDASTVGKLVLLQYVHPTFPAISPLVAMGEVIRSLSTENISLLQADNDGLLFIHRSGTELHAHASSLSLKSFQELPRDARATHLPAIHTYEAIVSGDDLDNFGHSTTNRIQGNRPITLEDFAAICELTPEARAHIAPHPYHYTLAIGAARAVAKIGGWL